MLQLPRSTSPIRALIKVNVLKGTWPSHTDTHLVNLCLATLINIYPTKLSNHGPNIHQNCPNIATLLTALYTISISVAEFKASHRTVTSLCSFLLYCVALLVTTGSQNARFSPGKQENNVKHDGLDGPNTRCLEKARSKLTLERS